MESYSSIYTFGHRALHALSGSVVDIEEKIDGSQISFGIIDGELKVRSRRADLNTEAPEPLFAPAIKTISNLAGKLKPGWVYRGEAVCRHRHNTLTYSRTPVGGVMVFDINQAPGDRLIGRDPLDECERLGLEFVPVILYGESYDRLSTILDDLLDRESVLGGAKIEGVVFKPTIPVYGPDKKILIGKHVSAAFREVHQRTWKDNNPGKNDILFRLSETYRHENRWRKAMQHLREAGELEGSPKDISRLIKAVQEDVAKECREEIEQALYRWAAPHVMRGAVKGLPEWYKEALADG